MKYYICHVLAYFSLNSGAKPILTQYQLYNTITSVLINMFFGHTQYNSQFHSFCLMKSSRDTRQNLAFYWSKKIQIYSCCFLFKNSSFFKLEFWSMFTGKKSKKKAWNVKLKNPQLYLGSFVPIKWQILKCMFLQLFIEHNLWNHE